MATTTRRRTANHSVSGLENSTRKALVRSFLLHVRAGGRTERTAQVYGQTLDMLQRFSDEMGFPSLEALTREHVEHFYLWCREVRGNSWGCILHRHRTLSVFFRWLREEGERQDNPMQRIKPPKVEQRIMATYTADDMGRLLTVTGGRDLIDLRDTAIILVLYDCGLRAQELCDLTLDSFNRSVMVLRVMGKGRKERLVGVGFKAAKSVDRYIRNRNDDARWLFLSGRGQMSYNGVRLMLGRRFRQAGIGDRYAGVHGFRRSFAVAFLDSGGSPLDLQTLAGWSSPSMTARYVRASQTELGLKAHRQHSPADRLR